MNALTVRQPWAWAIAAAGEQPGAKNIENRSPGAIHWQPCRNLAIHAGKTWSTRGAADERVKSAWVTGATEGIVGDLRPGMYPELDFDPLGPGLFLAVVDMVDVHRAVFERDGVCCRPWGEGLYADGQGNVITEVTHLVFENCRTLIVPVPWTRGRLGLWTVPPSIERDILDRVSGE